MPSKHAKVWKALKTHLEAYPDLPTVAYGGQRFDPPAATEPYLIVDDVRFDAQRKYQNTNGPNWQTGSLAVHCMLPLDWTDMQSAEYAGDIADYFAQDTPMSFDDVTLRVSRQPTVDRSGYRDGGYFRVPLMIPWEGWV